MKRQDIFKKMNENPIKTYKHDILLPNDIIAASVISKICFKMLKKRDIKGTYRIVWGFEWSHEISNEFLVESTIAMGNILNEDSALKILFRLSDKYESEGDNFIIKKIAIEFRLTNINNIDKLWLSQFIDYNDIIIPLTANHGNLNTYNIFWQWLSNKVSLILIYDKKEKYMHIEGPLLNIKKRKNIYRFPLDNKLNIIYNDDKKNK